MNRRDFLKLATAMCVSVVLPWMPINPKRRWSADDWAGRENYSRVFLDAAEVHFLSCGDFGKHDSAMGDLVPGESMVWRRYKKLALVPAPLCEGVEYTGHKCEAVPITDRSILRREHG